MTIEKACADISMKGKKYYHFMQEKIIQIKLKGKK